MAVFKCKMCGGALEINDNQTVATCEYCGTTQTLPKLDDDNRANMYDRANHFRRNNEYDKAMGIYEQILNEDNTDAEAYWSLVLCKYGIEYVEDPTTHKRIPTVNRTQYTSVFDDDNYKSALQYADGYQKQVYQEEATAINEIQKGILAISQNEEPFDVFICYKETDNAGRRTPDSVLANDLYYQLTQEGFKVFFARITLEDKLGTAYEPYIFAALNSAKAMVVLGTKPEYFNAVWVRNEWSRYLALIKQGQKKVLIPAYKDMDPYDLPDEFSHLQAQDMSKLGFMQDLIRGIKKIVNADAPTATVVKETVVSGQTNIAPLLKRAFMFLEDGNWASADEYCEKVLDIDPENAQAYLGKLMSTTQVRKKELFTTLANPFNNLLYYDKVMRFGDEALKEELNGYIREIIDRNEKNRLNDLYERARTAMNEAKNFDDYNAAAEMFNQIRKYNNSAMLAASCREKAYEVQYNNACRTMLHATSSQGFTSAAIMFEQIASYKDSESRAIDCREKATAAEEQEDIMHKDEILNTARQLLNEESIPNCTHAIKLLKTIDDWKDAQQLLQKSQQKLSQLEKEEYAKIKKVAIRKRIFRIASRFICLCYLLALFLTYTLTDSENEAISPIIAGTYIGTIALSIIFYVLAASVYKFSQDNYELIYYSRIRQKINVPAVYKGYHVTSIGNYAFCDCKKMTKLILPSTLTAIGKYAFKNCKNLETIEFDGTKLEWQQLTRDVVYEFDKTVTVKCKDGVIAW